MAVIRKLKHKIADYLKQKQLTSTKPGNIFKAHFNIILPS